MPHVLQRRCQSMDSGRELYSSIRLQQPRLQWGPKNGFECRLYPIGPGSTQLYLPAFDNHGATSALMFFDFSAVFRKLKIEMLTVFSR